MTNQLTPPPIVEEGVTYRVPTRDDLPAIRALYAAVKVRSRPEGYDEWHLFSTPWGDSPALAAFVDDECIGMYLMLPAALRLGRESVPAVQAMDVMVRDDHRRQGVFGRLAGDTVSLAEARGFEVAYGFPNDASFPLYVRYRNADHVVDATSWAAYLGRRAWRSRRRRQPSSGRLERACGTPTDDELATLVGALHSEPDLCRIEKSTRYLRWRYSEGSGDDYEWLTLREPSGELVAALLIGERRAGWAGGEPGILRIQELFAGSESHAALLLQAAVARAGEREAGKVQMLVKDPLLEAALARSPLRPESTVHFVVRKLTTRVQGGNIHHAPYWRLISGDMDFY